MNTTWNIDATHSAGGMLVGDRVDVELDVQAVNTAARDAAA